MPQSLVKNYLHITFATKHRVPRIFPPHEKALYAYNGGICKKMNCPVLIVGGYTDHIHILCMLSKNITLVQLIKKIKGCSSKWIKAQDQTLEDFYWQDGYGAFSVNPQQIDRVIRYIKNQHKHHQEKSFQDEYLSTLKKNNMTYQEEFLWD